MASAWALPGVAAQNAGDTSTTLQPPPMTDISEESLLLLEDHDALAHELGALLARRGWQVRHASTVARARRHLETPGCTLAVVDVGLPDGDGVHFAAELRAAGVAVVFLSARREVEERVRALQTGDAWLTKPVDIRELDATLRAVLRRLPAVPDAAPAGDEGWLLRQRGWALARRNSRGELRLTLSERTFLAALQAGEGEPVPRDAICRQLALAVPQGGEWHAGRRLEMMISRLRARVQATFGCPLPVSTARGVGYALSVALAGLVVEDAGEPAHDG